MDFVLEGGNMDRAVSGATWGSMLNSGQMYLGQADLRRGRYDEFVEKLTDSVGELKQGIDGETAACVGAMTMLSQQEKVEAG